MEFLASTVFKYFLPTVFKYFLQSLIKELLNKINLKSLTLPNKLIFSIITIIRYGVCIYSYIYFWFNFTIDYICFMSLGLTAIFTMANISFDIISWHNKKEELRYSNF